jgi:L-arabinose isomerase
VNEALMDFGNRFRLIVNEVEIVRATESYVETACGACTVGIPSEFRGRLACWTYAGGAHHTGFRRSLRRCSKSLQPSPISSSLSLTRG